jgi:predicted DCC family thiol-disulfide oxidoreductase YuxK
MRSHIPIMFAASRKPSILPRPRPRLIYDGVCNLCTAAVKLLSCLDRRRRFEYVAYQQLNRGFRNKYGLTSSDLQGRMYLVGDGAVNAGPKAIADVCRLLIPFAFVCNLFKTPQAQRLYEWVARRRYRIFGCRESCYTVQN